MVIDGHVSIQQLVALVVVGLVVLYVFAVLLIDEIAGRPPDATTQNILQFVLSFVLGAMSALLGVHEGKNGNGSGQNGSSQSNGGTTP